MNKRSVILICAAAFAAVCGVAAILFTCPTGHLDISVTDVYTLLPVEAHIVLPEHGVTMDTEKGRASVTGLPIKRNAALNRLCPQPWGETTLLVYARGYISEAVYHVHIYEDKVRRITVYMFPAGSEDEDGISVIESPEKEWNAELLGKFSP